MKRVSGVAASRPLRLVAAIVLAAAWLPAFAGTALVWADGDGWPRILRLVITALVYAPVAAVAITRRRWAVGAIAGSLAVSKGVQAVIIALSETGMPHGEMVEQIIGVIAREAEVAALTIMLWLFVRHRVRWIGIAVGGVIVVADALVLVLGPLVPEWMLLIPTVLALLSFPVAAVVLAVQWGRGTPAERETLVWFLLGVALMVASYLVLIGPPVLIVVLSNAAFVLAQGLLPTAILAAVFGGSAEVIDRQLVRGVAWAQALAAAISFYLVVDALAVELGVPTTIAGATAAGALALGFGGMLAVVRRRTEQVFSGPGADVRAVLSRLASRLDGSVPGEGLEEIAETMREIWRMRSVMLAPVDAAAVRVGSPGRAVLDRTLIAAGRPVCDVRLTADDRAVLDGIVEPMLTRVGPLLAVAVQLAAANQEVSTVRGRMLEVRREEGRMLHRELHEELAPALAGVGFAMSGAGRLIAAGDASAAEAVTRARLDLGEHAETVRRLARAMFPTALDTGDLEEAIRELDRTAGIDVDLGAAGTDDLSAEIQVVSYLLVADMLDVLQARRAEVIVRAERERVVIRVWDRASATARVDIAEEALALVRRRASDAGGRVEGITRSGDAGLEAVIPR